MTRQPLINRDYKSRLDLERRSGFKIPDLPITHFHWALFLVGIAGFSAYAFISPEDAEATRSATSHLEAPLALPPAAPEDSPVASPEPQLIPETDMPADQAVMAKPVDTRQREEFDWRTVTVKRGDSMARIFSRLDLSARELHDLMSLKGDTQALTRIFPGETLKVALADDHTLQALDYRLDDSRILQVRRNGDGFGASIFEEALEVRVTHAMGVIDSSLFLAAQQAGLPDRTTMELANIFGWDVDFVLDIREGDSFSVMYEEIFRDGEKLRNGNILAARFTNQGKSFDAVRYVGAKGQAEYYTPDGLSMRKTFLRAPLSFTRISSKFSLGRKHPILNKIRAHKGVDYAAPTGTPVKTTGDGKIVFRGRKGGYGNVVIVQHGTQYSTLYAHLRSFKRGQRVGSRVRQGDVIAFVGSSGLATGPHLHYEFRVNGVHRNPLRVAFPKADPIAPEYKEDFLAEADRLMARLERMTGTAIAFNTQQ